ncbi:SDR family oxidoreductase [Rhizobacter sp. LjRoot28]|uniref:SDR family oxidoreductase n=1 Tax=Rhizobacter sp. LjRoot28 TaxID=3342309 RepID=UPI003ECF8EB0
MRLEGKVAIITGASSGIGRAAALLFADEGAKLVLAARGESALRELTAEIEARGGSAVCLPGDVRQEAYARELVDVAQSVWGRLDVAFNNAGTLAGSGDTTRLSLDDWNTALETNLSSAFLGAKYQIPAMLKTGAGSLVFTSSFVGHTVGFPGMAAYAASKAGLVGLTQALAAEFGSSGLRVNALLPGGTDTPMAHQMNGTPEAMAQVASIHALKRLARPDEIAEAGLFLASDASSFMTGAAMLVDGGISISRT